MNSTDYEPAISLYGKMIELEQQLVAAQANNKMLREALERLACLGNGDRTGNSIGNEIAIDALSCPTDDTALKALLAAERERCAKEAERQLEDEPYGHAKFRCANIASEIRALGDAS